MPTNKMATCHPDAPLVARGLCRSCYNRNWHNGVVAQFASTMKGKVKVPRSVPRQVLAERKDALKSFDSFCEMQALRLMGQDILYLHPLSDMPVGQAYSAGAEYVLTPEEIHAKYREQRLGPSLDADDKFFDRIHCEWRA